MPEETEHFVRIPVAKRKAGDVIRTMTVSKREGIKALYCVNRKLIVTYLFAKAKGWTMSKAKTWLKAHKALAFSDLNETGATMFCSFNESKLINTYTTKEFVEAEKKEPKEVEEERLIFLFSGVYDYTAEDICRKLLQFDKENQKEPVRIIISSFGGSVYASFAITDMIEYVRCPIQTIALGKIMSAGLMIFMAGDERQISQNASILSHRFSGMIGGSQAELKARQREFEIIHNRMIAHYVKHTNLEDKREIESKVLRETDMFLTPEQALEYGIADSYFDQEWVKDEAKEDKEKVEPEAQQYECECIKCDYTIKTDKHCNTLKCKKCGGQMRRKSRPGPGQEAKKVKNGVSNMIEENLSPLKGPIGYYGYGSFGEIPASFRNALTALSAVIRKIESKSTANQLKAVYALLTTQNDSAKIAFERTTSAVAILKVHKQKDIIELIKASSVKKIVRIPRLSEAIITESAEIATEEWAEASNFRFRGTVLHADTESGNGRFYPADVVRRAVEKAQHTIAVEGGLPLTVMLGHPKDGNITNPLDATCPEVGRVVSVDLTKEGKVNFEAEVNDTSFGKDAQELLRSKPAGSQPLSLRAGGKIKLENSNGKQRERVMDMNFKGFDLVRDGGIAGAVVTSITK